MMPVRRLLTALVATPLLAVAPRVVQAQCTNLPVTSPEAKLFGFYTVPLAFSTSVQPDQLRPWQFRVSLELTPMPAADPTTRTSACHSTNKGESTNLASIFPRPRVAMGLPYDLEIEASYVPPLQVKNAKANLLGLALAWTRRVAIVAGASVIAQARVHTLIGSVEGPITCDADALQASNTQECWGKQISNDRFTPNVSGGELSAAVDLGDYAVFLTGGMNTMQPELQVNFQPGAGYATTLPPADRSLVTLKERLNRYTLGGGATWRMFRGVDLTGQVYTSPDDVAIYRMLLTFKL